MGERRVFIVKLYEVTGELLEVLAMAEDPEIDPDVFADTLEAVEGDFEYKADGYAKIIRQLEYEAAAFGAEAKLFKNKEQTAVKKIDRMKGMLKEAMMITGKEKFKTDLFEFGIRNNKPSVVIDDLAKVPQEFLKFKDPEADKTAIYKALKDGGTASWAHLEPSTSLSIK